IKLDTNGCHPEMLKKLLDEQLVDYAAMDIKNSPDKYAQTAGLARFDMTPVLESIRLLKESDIDYEFRTTVVGEFHEAADFHAIGEMIRGARHYYLQCFTDRDTVPFKGLHAPSAEAMREYEKIMRDYVPDTQIRGLE
ncbi:MAG: anaerobic ribonucleoside-triphosphate reductase activating protein, partial [Solobacterium sp.]|nr:anaerobic ribonucleoside-triphosphate reductase activating protein [Solobacterium sp.]